MGGMGSQPRKEDPIVNRCDISPYHLGGQGDYHGPNNPLTRHSDQGEEPPRRSSAKENRRPRPWRTVPSRNSVTGGRHGGSGMGSSTLGDDTQSSAGASQGSRRPPRPGRATKVMEFTGEDKRYTLDHFVGQVEAHRAYYSWGSKETARIVRMNLGGEAQMALEEMEQVPTRWKELKNALNARFEPDGHEE